jgi:hypothetical protein
MLEHKEKENHQGYIRTSANDLFRSSAFQKGVSDYFGKLPFQYPERCRGPNLGDMSTQLAYEAGRQFAVWLETENQMKPHLNFSIMDLTHYLHDADLSTSFSNS